MTAAILQTYSRNHRLHIIRKEPSLAADSVECEILIEASPEVVWDVITEPQHISRWFSDAADVAARAGADGALTWRPGGRGGAKDVDAIVPIRVMEAKPFHRFSFRWNHPDGATPDDSNSALVEFTLVEEADGTRLRVVESGIDAVTRDEQDKARYLEDHTHGWEKHFRELLEYVASKPSGAAI
jgi:uncharacterized protein YndB with AHSA1/START domain